LGKTEKNSDNPIGRDTIGRGAKKIMLVSMNSKKKVKIDFNRPCNNVRARWWNNDIQKAPVVVSKRG
jgi:hypothetical protein